jgi:hypothetical protein
MALIAQRPMTLHGHEIAVGQAVDGLWPSLRERTRRALLSTRRVVQEAGDAVPAPAEPVGAAPPKRKRGRPRKHPEVLNG